MTPFSRLLQFEAQPGLLCVRIRPPYIEEHELAALVEDLLALHEQQPSGRVALSLGPKPPQTLYSVFLAKLVSLQRLLQDRGAVLVLCEVRPEVRNIFRATALEDRFLFADSFAAAAPPRATE
jgi:hypothetical protein